MTQEKSTNVRHVVLNMHHSVVLIFTKFTISSQHLMSRVICVAKCSTRKSIAKHMKRNAVLRSNIFRANTVEKFLEEKTQ